MSGGLNFEHAALCLRGSQTTRPRQIRFWSFGLLICGLVWGFGVGVLGF